MLLETVYAPSVSLPKSDDVVNDGSVQVAPPAEVGGGVTGVEAGAEAVGVAVGWEGEAVGDVPGAEADGDDGDGDDDDDAWDGDGPAIVAVGVVGPVAVMVFSIMAACLPLAAACLGTYAWGAPVRVVAAPWGAPVRVAEVIVRALWPAAPLRAGCGPVA
jgi:hypothetical protein